MQTQETMFRNSAGQVGSKLFLDEPRDGAFPLLLPGEERLKVFCNGAVQHGLFGFARNIFEVPNRHAEASSSGTARRRVQIYGSYGSEEAESPN